MNIISSFRQATKGTEESQSRCQPETGQAWLFQGCPGRQSTIGVGLRKADEVNKMGTNLTVERLRSQIFRSICCLYG
jgi:hypothetical protein